MYAACQGLSDLGNGTNKLTDSFIVDTVMNQGGSHFYRLPIQPHDFKSFIALSIVFFDTHPQKKVFFLFCHVYCFRFIIGSHS